MFDAGRVTDLEGFLARSMPGSTRWPPACPAASACRTPAATFVSQTSIAVGITRYGHSLDFGAVDGPATVVLLIATPASSFSEHLEVLATMARSLFKENFRESLRRAHDAEVIAELINSSLVFFDH